MTTVSWTKMKEEAEDVVLLVSSKLPGKTIIWLTFGVGLILIFIIGFGVGFGTGSSSACQHGDCAVPVYYYVSNHSQSCPPLAAERLLTPVAAGQSFEGLTVSLECRGNYAPYPRAVQCRRKTVFSDQYALEWSHMPVCVPISLVTLEYWKKTLHAQTVTCQGDSQGTRCSLQCVYNYVAVEEEEYRCSSMPCPAWTINNKQCYQCQQNCDLFKRRHRPDASDMLSDLSCDPTCASVVVTSSGGAAVWQNKRTGLFHFIGEHNGRPLYRKNSTKEYLYYQSSDAEWLIGPDFKKGHGGIQLFNNDDSQCPERHGGSNNTKVYIDSGKHLLNVSKIWTEDPSISIDCYSSNTKVVNCSCPEYQVLYDPIFSTKSAEYYAGKYRRLSPEQSFSILAPVYYNSIKELFLFSHHPEGLVWQISSTFVATPVRGVTKESMTCPDSDKITWELYNKTTTSQKQIYLREDGLKLTCNW